MLCLALRPVNDKGELLKREEADAERKLYMSVRLFSAPTGKNVLAWAYLCSPSP